MGTQLEYDLFMNIDIKLIFILMMQFYIWKNFNDWYIIKKKFYLILIAIIPFVKKI